MSYSLSQKTAISAIRFDKTGTYGMPPNSENRSQFTESEYLIHLEDGFFTIQNKRTKAEFSVPVNNVQWFVKRQNEVTETQPGGEKRK